ncbi:gliding motility-associated C-terminal domain-containing protein [Vicingaceae bacterium]|nr:gliding motility-associated C-terminal domain-containing protein [Vicingaceae bacterium]
MRKYIVGLFVFGCCVLVGSSAFAQAIFAGGEIYTKYVGNGSETCNDALPYEITLRFFRDAPVFTVDPLPLQTDVWVVDITSKNPNTWSFQAITLDSLQEIPQLNNLCIKNNEIVTDGGYYSNRAPVLLDANKRYKILYGEQAPGGFSYIGYEFHSPSNSNINAGQRFFLKTEIHTFCDTVRTFGDDTPLNQEVVYNLGKNRGALWSAKTEILETICEGNSYRYDLKDYVRDPDRTVYNITDRTNDTIIQGNIAVRDSLSFRLKPIVTGENRAAIYVNPRNTYDPFPTAVSDPFRFDEGTGVMTFTPQLANGERLYTAPIVFEVTEWKRVFVLEDDGNGTGNFIRRTRWDTAAVATRQIRLLIADQSLCDANLPVVESEKWNLTEQAWEFNCASDTLEFRFNKPMLFRSFALEAPFDFRVFRGTDPKAPIDQSAYNPDAIFVNPDSVNEFGEFSTFRLFFQEGLGPGRYTLFTRVGNDTNTIENRCGFFMPEFQSTPFIINRDYVYTFKDDDDKIQVLSQKNFCFPGDAPLFNLDALARQKRNIVAKADSFHFSYNGMSSPFAPPRIIDSAQLNDSRFNVYNTITIPDPYDYDTSPLGKETEGYWTVGVGLNFPWYSFDGTKNDERCFDDDFTLVTFFTHPPVSTVDIDLCRQERWPVIRDLVDPKYKIPGSPGNPVSYSWVKYSDSVRTVIATNAQGDVVGFPGDTVIYNIIPVGGSSNGNSQAAGSVNDTLDLELGVGTGVGISSLQKIKVYVTFPNGCVDSNAIQIVKQDVNVRLSPENTEGLRIMDTTICRDEAFTMYNTLSEEYLRPEFMSKQWYYGENSPNIAIPNDTTDTLSASSMLQNGRGWYKLVVTKTTENSTCEGTDSIFVNIADSLEKTDPICSIVTFDKNTRDIRQRFYWPTVEGAERYEVRGIDQNGAPLDSLGSSPTINGEVRWFRANDTYGIHHWIEGKGVRLFVRAVNNEVPEGASCKYGEAILAEACEVLVKPTNVFTPNGDGINDVLRFDLLELYDGNKLQVFNRWGKLVFEDDNYQNDWDGGDLKDGTYFYILDIDDPSGVQDIFKGTITILR